MRALILARLKDYCGQMTTLISMRHAHVEGIHPERFRGRAEIPLTSLGGPRHKRWQNVRPSAMQVTDQLLYIRVL